MWFKTTAETRGSSDMWCGSSDMWWKTVPLSGWICNLAVNISLSEVVLCTRCTRKFVLYCSCCCYYLMQPIAAIVVVDCRMMSVLRPHQISPNRLRNQVAQTSPASHHKVVQPRGSPTILRQGCETAPLEAVPALEKLLPVKCRTASKMDNRKDMPSAASAPLGRTAITTIWRGQAQPGESLTGPPAEVIEPIVSQ